jgi:hypothetical protein
MYSTIYGDTIHICKPGPDWALGDGEVFAWIDDDFAASAATPTELYGFGRWFDLFACFRLHIGANPRRNEPNGDSNN